MDKHTFHIIIPAENLQYANAILLLLLSCIAQPGEQQPESELTDVRPPGTASGNGFNLAGPLLLQPGEKEYEYTVHFCAPAAKDVREKINSLREWQNYPAQGSPETTIGLLLLYSVFSRVSFYKLPEPETKLAHAFRMARVMEEKMLHLKQMMGDEPEKVTMFRLRQHDDPKTV